MLSVKDSRARSVSPAPEPAGLKSSNNNVGRGGIKVTMKKNSSLFQNIGKSKILN